MDTGPDKHHKYNERNNKVTGTALLARFMITCSNCGHSMADEAKFCPECGTAVSIQENVAPATQEETAPVEAAAQEETAEAVTAEPEAPAAQEEAAAPKAAKSEKLSALGDLFKKLPKKFVTLGVCVLALILVIGLAFGIANSGDKGFLLYMSDDNLFVADGKKLKPVVLCDISEFEPASSNISEDGTKWLLCDEDGALYYAELGSRKGPVKLASDYDRAYASEDFKIFTYTKDNAIYQCNAKGNAVKGEKKVQGKVGSLLAVSPDAKILYFMNEDGDYYVKDGRKDAQLICEADEFTRALGFTENYKTIYFLNDENTLCSKTIGKDVVEIVDNVIGTYGFYMNFTDGTFYAITSDDEVDVDGSSDAVIDGSVDLDSIAQRTATLNYINGTKVTAVIEELPYNYSGFSMRCAREADAAVLSYFDSEEAETVYHMIVGSKAGLWDEEIVEICAIATDGSAVYYIDSYDEDGLGDLYRAKVSANPSNGKLVDEDVTKVSLFANKPVYYKDMNEEGEGTLYYDGKMVSEDVYSSYGRVQYHEESGSILFYTDYNTEKGRGTLCRYNGRTKTIAEDVYSASFMTDGRICYILDYKDDEGDLYITSKRKPIADEVSDFATSYTGIY